MFCSNCGNKLDENLKRCSQCGGKIIVDNNETKEIFEGNLTTIGDRKKLRIVVIIGIILLSITTVVLILFNNGFFDTFINKVDFPLKHETKEIRKFMEKVCKNIDAENAEIEDIQYVKGYFGGHYVVTLAVELQYETEEKVYVSFYASSSNDSILISRDKSQSSTLYVSEIDIIYDNHCSEGQMNCMDAVIDGIERSFCGDSKGSKYTKEFRIRLKNKKDYVGFEDEVLSEYSLTQNARVKIEALYHSDGFAYGAYRIVD